MIANEMLHTMGKKKKPLPSLKLDIEKACDRLEWNFIEFALKIPFSYPLYKTSPFLH